MLYLENYLLECVRGSVGFSVNSGSVSWGTLEDRDLAFTWYFVSGRCIASVRGFIISFRPPQRPSDVGDGQKKKMKDKHFKKNIWITSEITNDLLL